MSAEKRQLVDHYQSIYLTRDVFGQDTRLYRAFVAALVGKIGLCSGARALDAGCGQGYLSRYLLDAGLDVCCSDLSATGLRSLERYGSSFLGKRIVADILRPPFKDSFDLVFQRSCSL